MRVVLLNQYYAPDEAATAQLLADVGGALAREGHEVVAICCDRSYANPAYRYPKEETLDGVRVRRVRASGFGRGKILGRAVDYGTFLAGAARRLLLAPRADVVISLTTPPFVAALGVVASALRASRSIFWVMDVYPDLAFELGVLRERSLTGGAFRRLARIVLRRSDTVVALDEAMARRLRAKGARDVRVVHNWSDESAIVPRPPGSSPLRREWGWENRFVVLYSGNLGLAHEFETILGAAERLRDREDLRFAFVGGGPRREAAEREVRRRGLPNVEFRPYVTRERLGDSLVAGDVHLVTLRPRMSGLLVPSKIYGILAAGRAAVYVGPPEGGVADIVAMFGCGIRLDNGDAEGLARVVREYASDPGRVEAHGAAARAAFEASYTRRHGTQAFVELLREPIRSRP